MTRLEKYTAWATILNPVVIAALGIWIQQSISHESTRQQYVELAIEVLREDADTQSEELRLWAVDVLNAHSPVPLNKSLRDGLIKGAVDLDQADFSGAVDAPQQ